MTGKTFVDWLKEEVEPKLRTVNDHFTADVVKGVAFMSNDTLTMIADKAISPFVYWLRDQGPLPSSASNPNQLQARSGTLSPADAQWLKEVGIQHHVEGPEGGERYTSDTFLGKDLYAGAAQRLEKVGFRWSKLQKAFIRGGQA